MYLLWLEILLFNSIRNEAKRRSKATEIISRTGGKSHLIKMKSQ